MDFTDLCTTATTLDAHKRVLFSHGLLLGVGEFRTEQNYFLEKHRRHARSLHGYGTVAGLAVTTRDTGPTGPEIRVSPGLAIDPHGNEICVPELQCALVNDWLLQQLDAGDLSPPLDASPPRHVTAYVTLCYRECAVDKVPVPVGPCHSLDKSSVASRLQDAFELHLSETAPAQSEDDAIRRFAALMARVSVATGAGGLTSADALLAEVRALAPDASPPAEEASVPPEFSLDPQHAAAIVNAALRVFVTEVRPLLITQGGGCLDGPRDETCVLLAQLDFDIHDVGGVPQVLGDVLISEDDRPLLLATRTLQELWFETRLLAGASGAETPPLRPRALPSVSIAPIPVQGPRLLNLGPAVAEPVNTLAVRESLGDALPALRFRRNGAATFNFPPPADLVPGTPFHLRLHWSYTRNTGAAPALNWVATLRLVSEGESVTASTPGARVIVPGTTSDGDRGRLLVTEPVDITVPAPSRPLLGTLEVRLETPQAIPQGVDVYLVSAELTYTGRGSRA